MELDMNSMRIGGTNAYTKTETVKARSEAAETEAAEATAAEKPKAEAATFQADGGKIYKVDTDTIERLKSESEQRMVNLVRQMLGQQTEKADMAGLISKDSVLNAIQSGKFSQEDVEQAQKDTADDGYWGVEQTSDRFVKYATALTGGDPEKLDSMIEAFEKGYAEAEKQWGGKLPELAQRTREATLKKFQDLKDQYANGGATGAAAAQSLLGSKVQSAMDEA